MSTTAMIVMEPGSDWPGQVGDETNVVLPGDGSEDLLHKTEEKLEALRRGNHLVRVAVLACNGAEGAAAPTARAQLARMLFGAVTVALHGRLILSASTTATLQLREELLRLAGALTEGLRGTRATVSVQFTRPSPLRGSPWRPADRRSRTLH
jgi:glutamate racemase